MEKIPFAKLFDGIEPIYDEILNKVKEIIEHTEFIGGEEVALFEKEFAEFTESKYAVGTSNGTDSIIIALKALGIGPGDTVLVPATTFIATADAVTAVGANVEFIDIEKDYYTIDPDKIIEYLKGPNGHKVKAIIPVHLYGQMADMERISQIAKEYNLKLIEDAAQAHGSKLNGHQPGYYSDIATYSFYPGKNLGAFGDAGAITANNEELYIKCKMLVNHGRLKEKYTHEIEGYNMRLDTIQAAILRIKLKHLNQWNSLRKQKAAIYIEMLKNKDYIQHPKIRKNAEPVWHIFSILIDNRDAVKENLSKNGIETGIHYPIPLHLQPAYTHKNYKLGDFPNAEYHASHELSLPFWAEITASEIESINSYI